MPITTTRGVLPATPEDRDRCTATFVAAFVNDPLMRWMLGGVMEAALEPERLGVVFEFLEQVGASHPDVDHWHLPGIGVDPHRQGEGVGSLLLAHTLAEIDRQSVVAYLESSNPSNVPLYEKFGFEVIAEIQAGDSPTVWPMLRPAQEAT